MPALPSHDLLYAAERALRRAQLDGDAVALEALLDDELRLAGPDGAIYHKEDDLEAYRRALIEVTQLDPSEEHIQLFGDIAVVSVRMEMRGTFQGASFAGPFRYTRVWRAHAEGWRVVAGHVSAVTLNAVRDGAPAS